MDFFELVNTWFKEHSMFSSVLKYLFWVSVVLMLIQMLRKFVRNNLPDTATRYKSQKAVEILGYTFIIILSITYFTGNIKDFTLAIGLFTAGVAITLQEIFLSIAGSFYIFIVNVYKPGDRIEINKIKGDVIDIDSIYTTIMEIGEWVTSDNYTGRIVKLSNAFVFKGPIYNYSQNFPFIWDEFDIPIRYGSDMELAKSIVIQVARDVLTQYTASSKEEWKTVVQKYYIEDAQLDPTLAITLTDNWAQFNLRYIVDYKKRRTTKNLLQEKIHQEVLKTAGKVVLSSATIEIIKIPEIKIERDSK